MDLRLVKLTALLGVVVAVVSVYAQDLNITVRVCDALGVCTSRSIVAQNPSSFIPAANDTSANWSKSGLAVIGGIPNRSTQCGSTVTPSGLTPPVANDDAAKINAAITACTAGQVVLLSTGSFNIDLSETIFLNKGVTLRGSGNCSQAGSNIAPYCQTLITKSNGVLPVYQGPVCGVDIAHEVGCSSSNSIIYMAPNGTFDWGWIGAGNNGCGHTNPCNSGTPLAADAAKGAVIIQVTSTTGYSVGNWVLIDEASGAHWQTDPIAAFGQTWASPEFLIGDGQTNAVNRVVWGLHNPISPIDNFDFGAGQYPYNTPQGISCGYGINCDRATGELHLISAIGAGPCPGVNCTITFDSPLTLGFRAAGGAGAILQGYISSGVGSSSPGSTLTVTSLTSGTIAVNQPLWWSGQNGSAGIGTPISYVTAGSGTSWTTSNAQNGGSGNTSISVGTPGSPVTFYAAGHNAQIYLPSTQSGGALSMLQQAGVENLSISRGDQGNISMQFCVYCWVKSVDSYAYSNGSVNMTATARSQITGSFLRDCYDCENNGNEYALALNASTTENLIDNSIFLFNGKSMVGRANGGGNVISYNHADVTFYEAAVIGNYFVDHSLNASHYLGAHHVLMEGNYANDCGDDDTHGNNGFHTYFRNWCVGIRSDFNDPSFTTSTSSTFNPSDAPNSDNSWASGGANVGFATGNSYPYTGGNGPMRSVGEMAWNYWHAFSGNVLGKSGVTTSGHSWVYSGSFAGGQRGAILLPGWNGISPYASDPNMNGSSNTWIWIDGNYDYYNGAVTWLSGSRTLPSSFYLTAAPPYFGPGVSCTYTWPWIDSVASPPVKTNSCAGSGNPAKARWDAGTPFVQP